MKVSLRKLAIRKQLLYQKNSAVIDGRHLAQHASGCVNSMAEKSITTTLTPFNAYVALSRSRGLDDNLFTQHPSEHLRNEDLRLEKLDQRTKVQWEALQMLISSGDRQTHRDPTMNQRRTFLQTTILYTIIVLLVVMLGTTSLDSCRSS